MNVFSYLWRHWKARDLILLMADGSIREVQDLATAIANLGPPAVKPLIRAIRNRKFNTDIRAQCVRTLGMMGAYPAVPFLRELAAGGEPRLRESARRAIVDIERKRAEFLAQR